MIWIFRLSIGNSTGNATEPWILVRTGMHMANEQYQQNSHKWKTWQLGFQTLERYRYWASFQINRLFHSATIFFQPGRLLELRVFHFSFFYFFIFWGVGVGVGGWGLGGGMLNSFYYWCCIPTSRPPRVIRRFKRRSCKPYLCLI